MFSGQLNYDMIPDTVETYDHIANTWSKMPNMINPRMCHSLIADSNKLFTLGGNYYIGCYEVCGNFCNKFVALKNVPKLITVDFYGATVVGSKTLF